MKISILGLVFFVLKSLLGSARQWIRETFEILTLKPRSIERGLFRLSIWMFFIRLMGFLQRLHDILKLLDWDF